MAMGMVVDSRQQAPFHSMGYDNMRYPSGPQFTNPWVSAAPGPNQMYASALPGDWRVREPRDPLIERDRPQRRAAVMHLRKAELLVAVGLG